MLNVMRAECLRFDLLRRTRAAVTSKVPVRDEHQAVIRLTANAAGLSYSVFAPALCLHWAGALKVTQGSCLQSFDIAS